MKNFSTLKRVIPLLALATAILLSPTKLQAQQERAMTATGTVVDVAGQPIVGVQVIAGPHSVLTDANGRFSVPNIDVGEIFAFSCIGMVDMQATFSGTPMYITMKEATLSMDEVIVVAYGEQKRSAFTGSAAVITAEAISQRPVNSVMDVIEGMAPGVQVQSTSSAPGSSPSFRIRGASSINAGRDPLMIVDGVTYESGWNNINPNDVESVTLLKDAASTAIYGARGGNGVILITTKKANRGEETSISFDAKFSISTPRKSDFYDVITEPGEYYERHYQAIYDYFTNNEGMTAYDAHITSNNAFGLASDKGGVGYVVYSVPSGQYLIGQNGKLNPNATLGNIYTGADGKEYMLKPDDWIKNTYKPGIRQDYNINVRGGSEKIMLLASAGYTNDPGITEAAYYERFTGRIKGTIEARKWLRLNVGLDVAVSDQNANTDYSNNANNIFSNALRVAPIYPVFIRDTEGNIITDANGKVYDYGDYTYGAGRPINSGSNRIQEALLQTRRTKSVKTGASGDATFIILPELTATLNVAYDERDRRYISTGMPFYGTSNPTGSVSVYHYKNQSVNTQQLINYSKNFNGHSVKATLLHEFYKWDYNYLYGGSSNMFSYFENQELAGAITMTGNNSYSRAYQTEGFGGRVLYDYKGIYHFDASYRRDGSTRFHRDHRWGNFYSFGAGYLISREDFFKVSWIDELKVKFSIGQNGNDQIGSSYPRYEDIYEISQTNGNIALGIYEVGNKNITWETRTAINTGIEFNLFKSRLSGSVEYYYNKSTDLLAYVSNPTSLGYAYVWSNVGDMRNSGVEIDLRGNLIQNKDWKWSMYVNAAFNNTKVLKLAEGRKGETMYSLDGSVVNGYASGNHFYYEGGEYKTWYLRKFAGIDESGRALYYTLDEETGEIGTNTTIGSATKFNCGSSQPKVIGGFGTSLSWRSFHLSVAFAYRLGGYVYDSAYASFMQTPTVSRTGYNYHKDTAKSWTQENPSDQFARFQYAYSDFTGASDRWLTKADYLSLQNVTLAYTIPRSFAKRIGAKSATVSVSADNPMFFSKRKGLVPTRDFDGDMELGYYTSITNYTLNISLKF